MSAGGLFMLCHSQLFAGLSCLPPACTRKLQKKKKKKKNLIFSRKAPNLKSQSTKSYGRNTKLKLGMQIGGIYKYEESLFLYFKSVFLKTN
jgi:hypothetical protein